jgi:hypothetical protein
MGIYTNVSNDEVSIVVPLNNNLNQLNFTDLTVHLQEGSIVQRTAYNPLTPIPNPYGYQGNDLSVWEASFRYQEGAFVYHIQDQFMFYWESLIDNNIQSTFQPNWTFKGPNAQKFFGHFSFPTGMEINLEKLPKKKGFPYFAWDTQKLYVHSGINKESASHLWGWQAVISTALPIHDIERDPLEDGSGYRFGDVVSGNLIGFSPYLRTLLDRTVGIFRKDRVLIWRKYEPFEVYVREDPWVIGPDDEFYINTFSGDLIENNGIYRNTSGSAIAIILISEGTPSATDLVAHVTSGEFDRRTPSDIGPFVPNQTYNLGDYVYDPNATYPLYSQYYRCNANHFSAPTFEGEAAGDGWVILADLFDVRDYTTGRRQSYIHVANRSAGEFPISGISDTLYVDSATGQFFGWLDSAGRYVRIGENYPYIESIEFSAEVPERPTIIINEVDWDYEENEETSLKYHLQLESIDIPHEANVDERPRLKLHSYLKPTTDAKSLQVEFDFNAEYIQRDDLSEALDAIDDPENPGEIIGVKPDVGGGMNISRIYRIPQTKQLQFAHLLFRGKNNIYLDFQGQTLTWGMYTPSYTEHVYLRSMDPIDLSMDDWLEYIADPENMTSPLGDFGVELYYTKVENEKVTSNSTPITSFDNRFLVVPEIIYDAIEDPQDPNEFIHYPLFDEHHHLILASVNFDLLIKYIENIRLEHDLEPDLFTITSHINHKEYDKTNTLIDHKTSFRSAEAIKLKGKMDEWRTPEFIDAPNFRRDLSAALGGARFVGNFPIGLGGLANLSVEFLADNAQGEDIVRDRLIMAYAGSTISLFQYIGPNFDEEAWIIPLNWIRISGSSDPGWINYFHESEPSRGNLIQKLDLAPLQVGEYFNLGDNVQLTYNGSILITSHEECYIPNPDYVDEDIPQHTIWYENNLVPLHIQHIEHVDPQSPIVVTGLDFLFDIRSADKLAVLDMRLDGHLRITSGDNRSVFQQGEVVYLKINFLMEDETAKSLLEGLEVPVTFLRDNYGIYHVPVGVGEIRFEEVEDTSAVISIRSASDIEEGFLCRIVNGIPFGGDKRATPGLDLFYYTSIQTSKVMVRPN